MSLTAAAAYLLKRSDFSFSDVKTGWKDVQRERARRDYQAAISKSGGQSVDDLLEYSEQNEDKLSSKLFEPGYCEEIQTLVERELEPNKG